MTHDQAMKLAVGFFTKLGYECRNGGHKNANGPDLTLIGKKDVWRVEVATVRKVPSGSWQTSLIQPNRRNDDFVFIALGKKESMVLPMPIFLAAANKDGSLTVTQSVRLQRSV